MEKELNKDIFQKYICHSLNNELVSSILDYYISRFVESNITINNYNTLIAKNDSNSEYMYILLDENILQIMYSHRSLNDPRVDDYVEEVIVDDNSIIFNKSWQTYDYLEYEENNRKGSFRKHTEKAIFDSNGKIVATQYEMLCSLPKLLNNKTKIIKIFNNDTNTYYIWNVYKDDLDDYTYLERYYNPDFNVKDYLNSNFVNLENGETREKGIHKDEFMKLVKTRNLDSNINL